MEIPSWRAGGCGGKGRDGCSARASPSAAPQEEDKRDSEGSLKLEDSTEMKEESSFQPVCVTPTSKVFPGESRAAQ